MRLQSILEPFSGIGVIALLVQYIANVVIRSRFTDGVSEMRQGLVITMNTSEYDTKFVSANLVLGVDGRSVFEGRNRFRPFFLLRIQAAKFESHLRIFGVLLCNFQKDVFRLLDSATCQFDASKSQLSINVVRVSDQQFTILLPRFAVFANVFLPACPCQESPFRILLKYFLSGAKFGTQVRLRAARNR